MKTVEISLFSGVGMFSYGFQRVNPEHRVGCFVEREAYPQRVLRHHWPDVPIYDDVRDVTYERLKEDWIVADTEGEQRNGSDNNARVCTQQQAVSEPRNRCRSNGVACREQLIISGGFPCVDLSVAGKQAGIDGERSGLWSEYARIISELRHLNPIVFIENVPTLFTGGDTPGDWGRRVLGDLAEIFLHGDQPYRVEGHIVPAGTTDGRLSAGAPHRRERAWIVAYPSRIDAGGEARCVCEKERGQGRTLHGQLGRTGTEADVAYPNNKRSQGEWPDSHQEGKPEPELGLLAHGVASRLARHRWLPEPGIGRVATGIPDRAAKLKALGNGLVWPIPAAFMAALMEYYE